jgi:predicted Zn-dependent peptidase
MNTFKHNIRKQTVTHVLLATSFAAAPLLACDKGETTEPEPTPVAPAEPAPEPEREYPDPPPPTDPRPVNFPKLQKFELPNKLQVVVVENHEVPLVSVQLVVRAGGVHDPLLADVTAAMLTQGTGKGRRGLSKADIDERIESVGASLGAGAGEHETSISTRVMTPDLEMALDLVAEVARNPRFDDASIEKIKDEQKVALRQEKSSGSALGSRLLAMKLYPEGHPYGRRFNTEAEIDTVTRDQIVEFHKTWYVPNNAFLILSGDVDPAQIEKLVAKKFEMWKPAEKFPEHPLGKFSAKDFSKPQEMVVHLVERKQLSTEVLIGNLSLARNHPDWIKWELTNKILGSGVGSRLFKDIRETRDLTYAIRSAVVPRKGVGAFVVATQTKKVDEMMRALFEHIDQIRDEDPSEDEFDRAQRALAQRFPLQVETAEQVAGRVRTQMTYGLADDYFATFRDKVLEVKREDVKATGSKHIDAMPTIVMVGRSKKVMKALREVPELKDVKVITYDLDLKKTDEIVNK